MEQNESLNELFKDLSTKLTKYASNGELAQLKRAKLEETPVPAFYRLIMPALENYRFYPANDETKAVNFEKNLMALLSGMAEDPSILNLGKPLGMALGQAGYPELRFYRLLKAADDQLRKQVSYMCRYLSSKGSPGNLAEAFDLMKSQENSEIGQLIRRRISRDYYRTVYQANKSGEKTNE